MRILALFALTLGLSTGAFAQDDSTITGEAALGHPAVQLALKAAELMKAGKIDDAFALRTKSEQSDWKALSASDRIDMGAGMVARTPDPKALAEAIRANGSLALIGDMAILNATLPGAKAMAYFERQGGAWFLTNGPMAFPDAEPVDEVRVEDADILTHPIGKLALEYLDLIHAGKIDDAKRLATSDVQAEWKSESAGGRAESLAFFRANLPTRAIVAAGLQAGTDPRGVLLIQDDATAMLNLITSTQEKTGPSTTTYSSTTTGISFAKENGEWRLSQ